MLNENQISKLQKLTEHPKFGQLLLSAIEEWKKEKVQYCFNDFGIDFNYFTCKIVYKQPYTKCCLIGAALISKEFEKDLTTSALSSIGRTLINCCRKHFNISEDEFRALWVGFDYHTPNFQYYDISQLNKEAFDFAKEVARNLL